MADSKVIVSPPTGSNLTRETHPWVREAIRSHACVEPSCHALPPPMALSMLEQGPRVPPAARQVLAHSERAFTALHAIRGELDVRTVERVPLIATDQPINPPINQPSTTKPAHYHDRSRSSPASERPTSQSPY